MSYNISKLPDYVHQANTEEKFLFESVLGGQTLDVLTDAGSYTNGVQGSTEAVHLMKNTLVWQNGGVCKLQDLGETELSQVNIFVAPIAFKSTYCNITLADKWTSEAMRARKKSLVLDELLFSESILQELTVLNQNDVEKILWTGNKSITDLGNNMRFIDGFLTQLDGKGVDMSGVSGATMVEKIRNGYLAMPVEVRDQNDFTVFIGKDLYDDYRAVISDKNLYNKEDADSIFGVAGKFTVVNGLNNTKKVVFARKRNLQVKGDVESASAQFDVWYEKNDDEMRVRSRFGLGCTAIFTSEIGVLDLA